MSINEPFSAPSSMPQQGWGQPGPNQAYPPRGLGAPFTSPPKSGISGLAIAGLVVASTALIAVLGVVVWLIATDSPAEDDASWGTLTGQVAAPGGAVSGDSLATAVRARIRDDGSEASQMTCPDTPAVGQSITTVCHGVIDSDDWAVVVFFEDTSGRFTLLPV